MVTHCGIFFQRFRSLACDVYFCLVVGVAVFIVGTIVVVGSIAAAAAFTAAMSLYNQIRYLFPMINGIILWSRQQW